MIIVIIVLLGFVLFYLSLIYFNKKINLNKQQLFFSYILFGLSFFFFAKLFNVIVDWNIDSYNLYLNGTFIDKIKFILSGYSFIGGYLGGIIVLLIYGKATEVDNYKLLSLYLPSLLLLYSILKFICLTLGCCESDIIPIQLIEIIINFILYIVIFIKYKKLNNNKIVGYSLIYFGGCRFILSLFRNYIFTKSFYIIEIICLIIFILGIIIIKKKK